MIELKNITKLYNNIPIINNVSLKIARNEVLSIIGPSGSGKSTLLRCINFLDIPDSGEIFFKNVQLNLKNANKIRQKIGMVFQSFNLFPHMTVLENVYYAPINILGYTKPKATKQALCLLDQVGLSNKANSYPQSLSGGQKQRVAIARALAMNPEVMLFDEPTSALDLEMTNEVLDVIKSFAHTGLTIVLVSHEINFVKELADRVIFFDHGKIIEEDSPQQFFNHPQSERARKFLEKIL